MANDVTTPASRSQIQASDVENVSFTPPQASTSKDSLARRNCPVPPPSIKPPSYRRAQSTPPEHTNDVQSRGINRGTTGDASETSDWDSSWSRLQSSKKKSQYFTEAFAYREPRNTAKDRVTRDSVILAEVKLNYCVESEQELLIDLSFHLSEIYQRPASCVMVMISTEVSMLIGGNTEPAYHMTIAALPSEIAATKNKRTAHLIQDFMLQTLEIRPKRGVVRFDAVAEENLATNGVTAMQEIEELEGNSVDEDGAFRSVTRQKSRRSKKSSLPFVDRSKASTPVPRLATPCVPSSTNGTKESMLTETSGPDGKRVKRRKSIFAFFKK